MQFKGARLPFQAARRQLMSSFERSYVLQLLERHQLDVVAAAREAQMPVERLRALVQKHMRPYFVERVRAFYGDNLDGAEAERIADHLLAMELEHAAAG